MKTGRPTVLNDEVLARIAELRGEGLGYGTIAERVGVGRTTVRRVLGKAGFGEPCQNEPDTEGRPGRRP